MLNRHLKKELVSHSFLVKGSLALLVCLTHSVLYTCFPQWIEPYEMRFLDAWFESRPPRPPPNDIVIVAMDEDSYNVMGVPLNQPFPRTRHAQLIEKLASYGASRVVFDMLFLGASERSADHLLADAMRKIPVVLGADFGRIEDRRGIKLHQQRPLAMFQQRSERLALVGFPEDYGSVRRFLVEVPNEMSELLPLAAAAAPHQKVLPEKRDLIDFYGPPGVITTIPYYQVLDEEIPEKTRHLLDRTFRGKNVFVGLTMKTGLGAEFKDSYRTPVSGADRMFGVEIHANAAGNIGEGKWIRRFPHLTETIALGITAFLLSMTLFVIAPLAGAVVCVGAIAGWCATGYLSFTSGVFVPGAFLISVLLPICYLVSTIGSYLQSVITQQRFRRAFELYLSPEMAARLAQDKETLKLGGKRVTATALFTDIEGFTSISERLSAEEVAEMLNAYFSEVMDVIFQHDGTLMKFIGDAVFALWGAPINSERHTVQACQTALAIERGVEAFNARMRFPPLHTRIGLHAGPLVVGNLGSKKRFDYTAIGDTVNLAARIEGVNRYFGTKILVTETVRASLDESFYAVFIATVAVAGKDQAVAIYTLLQEPLSPEFATVWKQAVECFATRDWSTAESIFSRIGSEDAPLAQAALFYLTQIRLLREQTIPPAWKISLSSK
jgi:adenylate cyclase